MGKDLLPMLAGVGLAAATGGLGAGASGALGAAGGTGAAGAGAAGALGAGNALAAQGAAGLLGGAGATAAGYGAGAGAAGLGAAGGAGASSAGAMADPSALASQWGDNIGTLQNTIESSGMTANPYTGGFDNLSGVDRIGQRVSGFLDDGGMDTLGKFKSSFNAQPQQAQQAQNTEVSGGSVAQPQEPQGQVPFVYGQPQIQLTEEQKRLLAQGLL